MTIGINDQLTVHIKYHAYLPESHSRKIHKGPTVGYDGILGNCAAWYMCACACG